MVTQHLGLVGEIVGIDADAMPADQAGAEGEKIPLGAGGLQDFQGIDADLVEDQGQLIHQGDVEIALGVLDHLGRFGDLDAGRTVHTRGDDGIIQFCHLLQRICVIARNDFHDLGDRVFFVAGIDPFGRITRRENPASISCRNAFPG